MSARRRMLRSLSRASNPGVSMKERPRRTVIIVVLLLVLILVPLYFFLTTSATPHGTPGGETTITASSQVSAGTPSNGASFVLSPATPLVAPGQTQNYTTLSLGQAAVAIGAGGGSGNITLSAVAPPGLAVSLSPSSLPIQSGQPVTVTLAASSTLAPGDYQVTIRASGPSSSSVESQQFTVMVVQALVVMHELAFHPAQLTVPLGTDVYWINLDSNIGCCDPGYHNVHFTGSLNVTSPDLKRLETWNYTFQSTGSFYYICTIHPYMLGLVNVSSSATPPSAK